MNDRAYRALAALAGMVISVLSPAAPPSYSACLVPLASLNPLHLRLTALLGNAPRPTPEALAQAVAGRDVTTTRRLLEGEVAHLLLTNLRTKVPASRHPFIGNWQGLVGEALPYLVPSPGTYGRQSWKWDLIFGAQIAREMAARAESPEAKSAWREIARGAVLSAFENQYADGPNRGKIPHMNFSGGEDASLWGRPSHSTLTQPPLTLQTASLLGAPERAALYRAQKAEIDWWLRERRDDDGLVYIIHPWESGRDAGRDNDSQLVAYLGRTAASSALATRNPGVKDPRWKQARFALLEAIQAKGTDVPSRQAAELFQLKSPDMAAHLILGMEQAARVAEETGRPTEARQLRAEAQRMRQAVNRRMWDEADGFYYSLGRIPAEADIVRSGMNPELFRVGEDGKIRSKQASAFLTLAADIPSLAQAERMLAAMKSADFRTETPLPTVATSDPGYHPRDYWRGSTWININYGTVRGLIRYGDRFVRAGKPETAREFYLAAEALGWKTVEATSAGFYEYYASDRGAGTEGFTQGPRDFTWSGLSLNVLKHIERAQARRAALPPEKPSTPGGVLIP